MENRRALLIGINAYEFFPPRKQLKGCVNDVNLFKSVLIKKFDFPCENVTVITDETDLKPTRSNILEQFSRLIEQTNANDIVVIQYSGHGSRVKNSSKPNGYNETIVPCDSGRQPQANKDIFDDTLNELLQQLCAKTGNITLLVDSCRSGHVFRDIEDERSPQERCVDEDERDAIAMGASASERARGGNGPSGWLPLSNRYTLLAACLSTERAYEIKTTG